MLHFSLYLHRLFQFLNTVPRLFCFTFYWTLILDRRQKHRSFADGNQPDSNGSKNNGGGSKETSNGGKNDSNGGCQEEIGDHNFQRQRPNSAPNIDPFHNKEEPQHHLSHVRNFQGNNDCAKHFKSLAKRLCKRVCCNSQFQMMRN